MSVLADLRFAVRSLRAKPIFTAIAVGSLALGIGANTAIFGVVESAVLRELPYNHADQLVLLRDHQPGIESTSISAGEFLDYRSQSKTLSGLAAFTRQALTLTGNGEPLRMHAVSATPNFFEVLGAHAATGRLFREALDKPGEDRAAVISEATWRGVFASDPAIVGRTLLLNSNLFHIVGVLPERESIPSETQVWVTPRFAAPEYVEDQRASNAEVSGSYGRHSLMALGRMRDGATIAETRAELNMIGKRIAAAHANSQGHYANLTPLHERLVGDIKPALWVLLGAVVLLLLIACANMAGLLISRSASRTRELAVRAALGASRGQIGRLVLTESFLLAIAGGAFGILLADQGQRLLAKYSPYDLPSALGPQMDFEVLAFCVAATLLSALLSGLVPALRSANADVQDGLKESAKGSSSGSANRLRRLLVTAEIALSVVLLCGASLLIHSFVKILDVQPGFDTTNVITARISLPSTRYSKANAAVFWDKLLKHVSALPGVESAAIQTALPMSGSNTSSFIRVSGRGTNSDQLGVSGGVFDALRIPLLSGRNFDGRETGKALPVAVVNRAFAEKVFPNQNPIGRKFDGGPVDGVTRVIGVVGDIRYDGLREPAPPMMYFSYLQYAVDSASLVVRTRQNSSGLANELRAVLHSLDAELPLGSVKPLADYVNGSLATRRFLLGLLSAFAALAILLAAIGLYGVLAFSVEQRTREIGIRVALGAARRQVLGSVFRECSVVAMAGLATGLCGALWASSLLKAFLYGVSGADYLSYVTAAYLVLIIAALAALFPALRAIRVGPATALRYE